MYIVQVIPLSNLPPQLPQLFSYFFDRKVARGALVQVPISTRFVKAVVVSSDSLDEQKVAVKRSSFQLKKLTQVISEEPVLGPVQLSLALWLSKYYFAPLGACLKTALPPFAGIKKYRLIWPDAPPPAGDKTKKPLIILSRAKDSPAVIRSLIQEGMRLGQVLFITPETQTARYFAKEFKDLDPVLVHSGLANSLYHAGAQSVSDGSSRLVIGTRAALFLPFRELTYVLVDDPLNEAYKSEMSPKINAPDVAQKLARMFGARIAFITTCLNAQARHWTAQSEYEIQDKLRSSQTSYIVSDSVHEIKSGNFSLFSRQLQQEMVEALEQKKRILLYSARKAYSAVLLCRNCGAMPMCAHCNIPMRVHKAGLTGENAEPLLVCYRCSAWRAAPDRCANCQSKELKPAGFAGSQKVKEQLEQLLQKHGIENARTFILDSDLVRTPEQELELFKDIAASPLPVVIATSMIFSHRYETGFDLIGVISADALLTNPDFRTEERFLYQMRKLEDLKPEKIVLQTFDPSQKVLAAIGDPVPFFDLELAARLALDYPPFSRLVKLTFKHPDRRKASHAARVLGEKLKMAIAQLQYGSKMSVLGPSPALTEKEDGKYAYHIVLKLAAGIERPDVILKYVPSNWAIDADPRSL